jgi:DNA-binding NtrC family response regulator
VTAALTIYTGPIEPFAVYEERIIRFALQVCGGNITEAAHRLRIGRATMQRKIKAYKIDRNHP